MAITILILSYVYGTRNIVKTIKTGVVKATRMPGLPILRGELWYEHPHILGVPHEDSGGINCIAPNQTKPRYNNVA